MISYEHSAVNVSRSVEKLATIHVVDCVRAACWCMPSRQQFCGSGLHDLRRNHIRRNSYRPHRCLAAYRHVHHGGVCRSTTPDRRIQRHGERNRSLDRGQCAGVQNERTNAFGNRSERYAVARVRRRKTFTHVRERLAQSLSAYRGSFVKRTAPLMPKSHTLRIVVELLGLNGVRRADGETILQIVY